ncbi:MAG: DUF397 domain-containing protein [Actinobacteria bacterium]|nr:MAG: DUF397 domain-containing protein [Actinomycetota bacterium]
MRDRTESWRRSSRCDTQTCLEMRVDGERVVIRNSARPDGPTLTVSAVAWRAFCDAVATGELTS